MANFVRKGGKQSPNSKRASAKRLKSKGWRKQHNHSFMQPRVYSPDSDFWQWNMLENITSSRAKIKDPSSKVKREPMVAKQFLSQEAMKESANFTHGKFVTTAPRAHTSHKDDSLFRKNRSVKRS
jgi:hypothetical protein